MDKEIQNQIMMSMDPTQDIDEEDEEANKISYETKILMGNKSQKTLILFSENLLKALRKTETCKKLPKLFEVLTITFSLQQLQKKEKKAEFQMLKALQEKILDCFKAQ